MTEEYAGHTIKRYQKVIYFLIFGIALVWCTGILFAPRCADCDGIRGDVSKFLYQFYSKSCHQEDARSFHLWENPLGVCSRCTAIYFSFLLATLIYPFVRRVNNIDMPPLWLLFLGGGLVALDAGLDIFDVVKNTFFTRDITGAVLGFILAFFIIPGTMRLFYEFFQAPKVIPKKTDESSK